MKKTIAIFGFSALCALGVSTAQAGVSFRVGVPSVYVGPAPCAPSYYAPAPSSYSPGPAYYAPGYAPAYAPSIRVAPPQIVIAPPVLQLRPPFFGAFFGSGHRHHGYSYRHHH